MGRPKKTLTDKEWGSVDYMAKIHCTGEEIAGVLQMDYDTLNRNSKEKWGIPISEYIKEHSQGGKMSLRRAQWKSAENGNATMQIWLGKQWLGQKDQQEISVSASIDNTVEEMENYFAEQRGSEEPDME